jgi:cytochrome c oxidase cbb3-type subunit II
MPAYPWLERAAVAADEMPVKLRALQRLGEPYSDDEVKASADAVRGKSELDALVAYLQVLGTGGPNAKAVTTN